MRRRTRHPVDWPTLGSLVLLLGSDTTYSIKAALVFVVVHGLYKATLFMITGTIDKKTGTRNIPDLGGLYKQMPVTAITAILGLLLAVSFF